MKKERYFVIGFRKIKTAEEYKNKVVGHNHRTRHYIKNKYNNIDWERTPNNIILQDLKYKNADQLINNCNNNLKGKSRKLKKNSAFAFEIIVDCSVMENWSEQDYIRYLEDAVEFFKHRFKGQELISAAIHMDEGKPHLHLVFSYFNVELGKWNQRGLMKEKKTDLNKILDDFKKEVGKKYGLERGKGKELNKPLKKELAKAAEEKTLIEKKLGILPIPSKKKIINVKKAAKVIKNLDNKYKKALYENENLKEQLIETKKENKELKNRIQELEKENTELKKQKERFLNAVNRVKTLEKELKSWKQAALKEREKRLNKQIPERLKEKTIQKIKEEFEIH